MNDVRILLKCGCGAEVETTVFSLDRDSFICPDCDDTDMWVAGILGTKRTVEFEYDG